jgi:glycosyltransferase involved in cell wall biosynthesis
MKSLNLSTCVDLQPRLDEYSLLQVFADTDVFALLRSPDRSSQACFPTRLPEFLATRRPVIVTNVGDIGLYFQDEINAMLVKPGDIIEVASRIAKLARDYSFRTAVGLAGLEKGALAFNVVSNGSRIFEWLRSMTAEGQAG